MRQSEAGSLLLPIFVPAAFTAIVAAALIARGTTPLMVVYNTAIAWPFAAFVVEKLRARPLPIGARLLDGAVVLVSLARAHPAVPGYSGHALFLGYAALTGATPATRIPAALVLVQVLAIKLVVWRDVL